MPKSKQPKRIKRRDRKPRGIADWSGPAKKHGPFGLFSNVKLFYITGIIIMVGSLALGGSLCRASSNSTVPTPAAETETPTPSSDQPPTPTVDPGESGGQPSPSAGHT